MPSGNWLDYKSSTANNGSGFAGGSGKPDDPYLIETAAQLAYMTYLLNTNSIYSSCSFKLTSDIDLSEHYWEPICSADGSSNDGFSGSFDGSGHYISNMIIDASQVRNSTSYLGFIAIIKDHYTISSSVHDLIFKDPTITLDGYGCYDIGIVCGWMVHSRIENVSCQNIKITVINESSGSCNGVGGIVGGIQSSSTGLAEIAECDVYSGYISCISSISSNILDVGGIAGHMSGLNKNCYIERSNVALDYIKNINSKSGKSYTGGIVGSINPSTGGSSSMVLYDCTSTIKKIYTNSAVSADNCSGGIVGAVVDSCKYVSIKRCIVNHYTPVDENGANITTDNDNSRYHNIIGSSKSYSRYSGTSISNNYYYWGINDGSYLFVSSDAKDFASACSGTTGVYDYSNGKIPTSTASSIYVLCYDLGVNYTQEDGGEIKYRSVGFLYRSTNKPFYKIVFNDSNSLFKSNTTTFTLLTNKRDFAFPDPLEGSSVKVTMNAYTFSDKRYVSDLSTLSTTYSTYTDSDYIYDIDQDYYISDMVSSPNNTITYKKDSSTLVEVEETYYRNASGNIVSVSDRYYRNASGNIV